ncbi:MAG: hypothetical protein HRT56_02965, partial [Coraliomargarita sp.]|nr:hypothetical protein [Coraliomargarita sp.]
MKKHIAASILTVAPLVLWAQAGDANIEDIDLSDVVIIDDAPAEVSVTNDAAAIVEEPKPAELAQTAEPEVEEPPVVELVDIPEAPVEGASLDATVEIPTITAPLPEDTAVVLELPGQAALADGATMAEEETISVDFPDEDVRVILFNVAELFDLNLVVPDTLQGRTSLKLHNITWRDVFDVVLEPLGFAYVEDRNIIKVKSIEDIAAEPVTTTVIAVKYARAGDLIGSVTPLVDSAAGGKIVSDSRKNLLIVTERPSRIQEIRNLVDEIDKATDQVMIE